MRYVPLLILSLTFNFWVSHWEKYNTGVLYLPWMFDISQVVRPPTPFLSNKWRLGVYYHLNTSKYPFIKHLESLAKATN